MDFEGTFCDETTEGPTGCFHGGSVWVGGPEPGQASEMHTPNQPVIYGGPLDLRKTSLFSLLMVYNVFNGCYTSFLLCPVF